MAKELLNGPTTDDGAAPVDAAPARPEPSLLDIARQTQSVRARTARFFPRDIFRDSAWDMMLELLVTALEGRTICVKQLVLASGETSTSALRRIDRLAEADLLVRSIDPADHRRITVTLTARGREAMEAMLRSLFAPDTANAPAPPRTFTPADVPVPRDRGA